MRIDPDQVIQLSENFYQAAINKAFHGNQIRVIYQATEPDKLTYLHLLDAEGADIYSHIRRSEQQRIQNIADNLLNAEKKSTFVRHTKEYGRNYPLPAGKRSGSRGW